MKNAFVWAAGSLAALSTIAMAAVACSNSADTTVPPLPQSDSGTHADGSADLDSGSVGDDAGSTSDTGAKDSGPGAADCGKAPVLRAPAPDGGIFCPFSAVDGGKNLYCPTTDQCCAPAKGGGASTCVAKGTACPVTGSTVYECEDPADCPSSQKCCAHGGDAGVTLQSDTCGPFLSKFNGTRCAATCGANELVVCEAQGECTTGTCTPVKPKGNEIGVCK